MTFVQRFGGAINLNPQFHVLVLAGIYIVEEKGEIAFRHVAPAWRRQSARVTQHTYSRVTKLLERRGLGSQASPSE